MPIWNSDNSRPPPPEGEYVVATSCPSRCVRDCQATILCGCLPLHNDPWHGVGGFMQLRVVPRCNTFTCIPLERSLLYCLHYHRHSTSIQVMSLQAQAHTPTGPPPRYAAVMRKVYPYSLRPIVIFTAILGLIWCVVMGAEEIRDMSSPNGTF